MYLSKFTDYSFRALIFLAKNQEKLYTIEELSKILGTPESHMKKVIHNLSKNGYVLSLKGRCGGLKLSLTPSNINLGEILVLSENLSEIIECFNPQNSCIYLKNNCKLKGIANKALNNFIDEFKKYTLEDIL